MTMGVPKEIRVMGAKCVEKLKVNDVTLCHLTLQHDESVMQ